MIQGHSQISCHADHKAKTWESRLGQAQTRFRAAHSVRDRGRPLRTEKVGVCRIGGAKAVV